MMMPERVAHKFALDGVRGKVDKLLLHSSRTFEGRVSDITLVMMMWKLALGRRGIIVIRK